MFGLIVLLVLGGLPVWAALDAAVKPDPSWHAAGQSKVVWVLISLFLGVVGSLVYVVAIRPKVVAARTT
jgi:hypothetical protein